MPDAAEDMKCVIAAYLTMDIMNTAAMQYYHISKGMPEDKLQLWSPCVKLAKSEHSPFQELKY